MKGSEEDEYDDEADEKGDEADEKGDEAEDREGEDGRRESGWSGVSLGACMATSFAPRQEVAMHAGPLQLLDGDRLRGLCEDRVAVGVAVEVEVEVEVGVGVGVAVEVEVGVGVGVAVAVAPPSPKKTTTGRPVARTARLETASAADA